MNLVKEPSVSQDRNLNSAKRAMAKEALISSKDLCRCRLAALIVLAKEKSILIHAHLAMALGKLTKCKRNKSRFQRELARTRFSRFLIKETLG